jgi:hypothetical protein
MTTPIAIGVYTKQAGVWERCNAGSPEGFAGVAIHTGLSFANADWVETKVSSVWTVTWTNIDGEINLPAMTAADFDISPYNLLAELSYKGDGEIWRNHFGSGLSYSTNWRDYDCGRDYEIYFEHDQNFTASTDPVLDSWLDLTDPDTDHLFSDADSGTGFLDRKSWYFTKLREKVSAPAGGHATATTRLSLLAEV